MLEAEVAKSLSSNAAPHDDLSIYCDFDSETIAQDSVKSQVNKIIQIANLNRKTISPKMSSQIRARSKCRKIFKR